MERARRKETRLHACSHIFFFLALVKAVFRGFSFHGLLRGTPLPPQSAAETPEAVLAQFKEKANQIATLWSFIAYLDRLREPKLLQMFFESCPSFLHFFVHAVNGKVSPAEVKNLSVIHDLTDMKLFLEALPNFGLAFTNGELDEYMKTLSPDLSNMAIVFTHLVSTQNEPLVPLAGKESDPEKVRKALKEFLEEKGAFSKVTKFLEDYYDRYHVYGMTAWMEGLEICLRVHFESKASWDQAVIILAGPGGENDSTKARRALSEACFKCYTTNLVKGTGVKNPQEIAPAFYEKLSYLVQGLNDYKNPLEQRQEILRSVTRFLLFSMRLIKEEAHLNALVSSLEAFCKIKPDVFQSQRSLSSLEKFLIAETHPVVLKTKNRYSEGGSPIVKRKPNVKKIRENLQNDPYLLISHVAPFFIKALLPDLEPEQIQGFERALLLCKDPFLRSPFVDKFREIVKELMSDPFISAGLESTNVFSFLKEYLGNLKAQLNDLFGPMGTGTTQLGNSLTEKEISTLITEILDIRKVKNDLAQLTEKQKWMLENIPTGAKEISVLTPYLLGIASFLRLEIASLNLGKPIARKAAQTAAWAAGVVAKFAPDFNEKAIASTQKNTKTDLKSKIFNFLGHLTKEEKFNIETALDQYVIPLLVEIVPVILENHALGSYELFFKELSAIIQSDGLSDEQVENDRKKLTQLIACVINQLPQEIGHYEEALAAVYEALMYLEYHGVPHLFMWPGHFQEAPIPDPTHLALATITTTTMTRTTTLTTTTSEPANLPLQAARRENRKESKTSQ
jgi:hypothetical protein